MRARAIESVSRVLTRRGRWLVLAVAVAVAFAGQLMPETTKAAPTVDVDVPVPESRVAATCDTAHTDQTKNFLAWLKEPGNSAPHTRILFKENGCYWMNNIIDILNLHDLTFDGNGAVFKTFSDGTDTDTKPLDPRFDRVWPRLRSMWRLEGGYNLVLRNMTIVGSNGGPNAAIDERTRKPYRWDFHCPAVEGPSPFCLEAQAGITLFGVNSENKKDAFGAKVEGVTVKYTFGYGIELHGWGAHALNHNIQVRDSKIIRAGSMAIVAQNVDGAVFERNFLLTPRRSMFNIEPPTAGMPSLNVTVDHNLMVDENDPTDTKSGHFYMFANGGDPGARVENITISNNTLINQPVNAYINLGEDLRGRQTTRKHIWILNNVSNIDHGAPFPDQAPIRAIGVDDLQVIGNTQAIQPNQRNFGVSVYGVDGATSSNIVVRGNHFANALGALYTDPAIPGATVCDNRVGLDDQVDQPCAAPTARSQPPTIVVPRPGTTTVSGDAVLSARAAPSSRRVEYLISGRPYWYLAHLGYAEPGPYGWVYTWGTNKFPDGTYFLKARAYDPLGNHVDGPQIAVTVRNRP